MVERQFRRIFRKGSRTYFTSSWFFPRPVRDDVFLLYAFVRSVDNFVDVVPQRGSDFYQFWDAYRQNLKGGKTGNPVIESFTQLMKRRGFLSEWVDAFFRSMEMDLQKKSYATLQETLEYVHGSAEVIGLMMACIMDLERGSFNPAGLLGRAMQYINFLRDIAEDVMLGRNYFPEEDMRKCDLPSLNRSDVLENPRGFESLIRTQLRRYKEWQIEAEQGFRFIPRRYLVPIKTASDMYKWTAARIEKNPFIVYKWKVRPSKLRILSSALSNVAAAKS